MSQVTDAQHRTVEVLLQGHGTTYAWEAGIGLKDTPSPLYELLVLSTLLSARISAEVAISAARELFAAGCRTPEKMAAASWQQRVNALGRGHYRRYDERTSTMLGDGADLALRKDKGDLRRLRDGSSSTAELETHLQEFPGIGPAGAAIFCREVQLVWTDLVPYLDQKVIQGAKRLGLPPQGRSLASLVDPADVPRLAAACVRVALNDEIAEQVRRDAASAG